MNKIIVKIIHKIFSKRLIITGNYYEGEMEEIVTILGICFFHDFMYGNEQYIICRKKNLNKEHDNLPF